MPGRKYNAGEYRYGFNRMEKDDEFTGVTGSHLDFGARIYDSRLGRWMSIDPLAAKFPSVSSYNFVKNCPIRLIDADGRDIYIINKPSEKSEIKMTNHKQIIQWMYSAGIGEELITQYIDNPKTDIYIAFGDVGGNYGLISSFFDDDGNLKQPKTIEIGNHNLYNDVRKEFKYVEINTDKENHFILIDENVFKDKASDILSKKGAEILGHEMGHINNPKTSEEEDHLKWGQESLDDIKATGRAKEYNKQIDDSMKKSDELEFKEINPRGKYKLERKK